MGRITYEKACEECGGTFTARRIDTRFCGGACYHKFYRRENIEKVREARRAYDKVRREYLSARDRAWREKNADHLKGKQRQRYALVSADPVKTAARRERKQREYQDNREKFLARAKDRQAVSAAYRKLSAHGVEWDVLFGQLWDAQDGKCYLCGDPLRRDLPKAIHLDHDHSCCPMGKSCERCRRGLACKNCNLMIGFARDDPGRLRCMADALESANALVKERMQLPRRARRGTSWEKTCPCGTDFVAFRSDAVYCSAGCANRAGSAPFSPEQAPCGHCGEPFSRAHPASLYCSKLCAGRAERQRAKARLGA